MFAPRRTSTAAEAWSCSPGNSGREFAEETAGPPKFLDNPIVRLLMFFDSGRTACTRPIRSSSMAPAMTKTKAPCELGISELNSMAFGLAVYASRCRLPVPHARLASSRWSDATGQDFHPQGCNERFQSYISSSLPKLAWHNVKNPWDETTRAESVRFGPRCSINGRISATEFVYPASDDGLESKHFRRAVLVAAILILGTMTC